MNDPLQNQQDILDSITLTTQLETSLKKILNHKKKTQCNHQCLDRMREHERTVEELTALRAEREVLLTDNEMLSRELMGCKQQLRQLGKEARELKKYVVFLQDYNSSLKKEMAYWVKKPSNHNPAPALPANYQMLSQEIDQLKKMNDQRAKQLLHIDNSTVVVKPTPVLPSKQMHYAKSASTCKRMKNSITFTKNDENECTTCSYTRIAKSKKDKLSKNASAASKRSKLCSCHKSYIQTSDFLY